MRLRIVLAVLLAFATASVPALLLGCNRSSGSAASFGTGLPKVAASPAIVEQERRMFLRLNRDRKERGLPELRYDPKLADVARFHSTDMRDHKFFEHESPNSGTLDDRLNAAGYLFLTARENLSEAPDVETGQDALLQSPGHLANIVATDTTHVGIGIVQGGVEAPENLTITQVFAAPGRAESPAQARSAIVQRIRDGRAARGLPGAEPDALLNELAEAHVAGLDAETSPSSLRAVGERVVKALSERKNSGFGGVLAGAQLVPQSSSFTVPESLLGSGSSRFGLAVRTIRGASGRPMVQVLLLVAEPKR